MYMDNNFEQDFFNKVREASVMNQQAAHTPQVLPNTQTEKAEKTHHKHTLLIPFIISIGVIFIETIALIIFIINASLPQEPSYVAFSETDNEGDDEANTSEITNSNYIFNVDNNLIAFNLKCTFNDKHFSFSSDNTYTENDNGGTYSILNDSIVSIIDSNENSRTLYFDGFTLADGLDIYDCEPQNND